MPRDSSWPSSLSPEKRERCLGYWEERFGVSKAFFSPYHLLATSRTIYILPHSGALERLAPLKIQQAGLPFLRRIGRHLKPTTWAAQRWGHLATGAVLALDPMELTSLVQQGELQGRALPDSMNSLETGFVMIRIMGRVLGLSLWIAEEQRLLCRLPKTMRAALSKKS